jgi:hypothetical protein
VNVLHIMLVPQAHPPVAIHYGTPEIRFLTNEFNSALTSMAPGEEPGTRVRRQGANGLELVGMWGILLVVWV